MQYNPDKYHRRSLRLKGYDYSSPGAYFITICTYQRECLFGEIVAGDMRLNELGQIVFYEWERSLHIRQEIEFDAWVVMPNHIHGIVIIKTIDHDADNTNGANSNPPTQVGANGNSPAQVGTHGNSPIRMKPRSLSSFVAGFKSATTKQINGDRKKIHPCILRSPSKRSHITRLIILRTGLKRPEKD